MSFPAPLKRFSRPLSGCLVAVLLLSAAALASPPGRGGDGDGGRGGGGGGNSGSGGSGTGSGDGPWGGRSGGNDGGSRDGGAQRGGTSSGGSTSGGTWSPPQGGGGSWPSGGAGMVTARSAREEGGWDSGPDHWPGMGGGTAGLPASGRPAVARVPWFEGRLAGPRGVGRGDRGWPGYYLWDDGLWDDGGWYEDVWYGGTWGAGGWGLYVWGRYPWNWGPWGWGPWGWGPYSWGRYGRSQDPRDAPDWIPGNDGPWSERPSPFVLPNGSWPDHIWGGPYWLDDRWVARVWPDPYSYGAVRVAGGGGRRFHHPRSFYTLDVGVMDGRCDRLLIAGPAGFIPGPYGAQPWGRLPFTPVGAVVAADGDDDAFILTGAVDRVGMVAAMDAVDRICLAHTLEEAPVGHVVAWTDPFTHVAYVITPVRTYETAPGAYCRDYSASSTVVDADAHEVKGVACREADGAWRIVP